jgi:hypothetical protein
VLTTTPGGAAEVVEPVDVDAVLVVGSGVCSVPEVGVSESWWLAVCGSVGDGADPASEDPAVDESEEAEESGSAHAMPVPVNNAAPTPSATANPPTRPTFAAAFTLVSRSAQHSPLSRTGFTTFALRVVSKSTTSGWR